MLATRFVDVHVAVDHFGNDVIRGECSHASGRVERDEDEAGRGEGEVILECPCNLVTCWCSRMLASCLLPRAYELLVLCM